MPSSDEDFRAEMNAHGLVPPLDIPVEKWVRFPGTGKKSGNRAGYCYLFADMMGGIFGDFSTGLRSVWQAERVRHFTKKEKMDFDAIIAAKKKEAEEKQERKWTEASALAVEFISGCVPADPEHPYLKKKRIKPPLHGILQHKELLIIPIYRSSGTLAGYQSISPSGEKFYNSGLRKTGSCAVIDGSVGRVCVCEGFATGVSIHEATGFKVLVAMDSGNLIHIAKEATGKYENILVCADNDHEKSVNTGLMAARKIQEETGVPYVYPTGIQGTDFNDLYIESGLEAVADAIIRGRTVNPYQAKDTTGASVPHDVLYNPPGILKDIVDYYNATAVKPQPLFAVAAGLAIGSIILGRRYTTGIHNNYTALYMILAAKSGTGKDHVKQVIREVLKAADLSWMERGEGYTASNTVIKALEKQPLQISFFEEIGQRLQEAATNNRSMAKGVFRKLLDVWSSCHSFCVGEEFADGTVPRAVRPSLTMIGLTTPRAFTGAITESLIEQGFISRILPFISQQERSLSPLLLTGPKSNLGVPEKIVKWIQGIWVKGNLAENGIPVCPDEKSEVIVPFTENAVFELNNIEAMVLLRCNELEKLRLDDMYTRIREIVMRVSLIAAVMDGCDAINVNHVKWSWLLIRALYEQYISEIKRNVSGSDYEKAKLDALKYLRGISPMGIAPRKMPSTKPWSQWPKKLRDEILADLKDSGLAEIIRGRANRHGAKTDVWIATEGD